MNIAIVNWPLNDVGGINSWIENFMTGCRFLGHNVQLFHVTAQTRYQCGDEPIHRKRYTVLPGAHLSYREDADEVVEVLNQFDLVVFGHTSPHPTMETLSKPNPEGWMDIYSDVSVKKIVIFHDAKWRKTNDWFDEVRGNVDLAVAAQHHFVPSAEDWANGQCPVIWEYFPMATTEPPSVHIQRDHCGVIITQWLKWKRHDKLIPMLKHINVPMHMYGGGMEYHNLRKTDEWQANVVDLVKGDGNGLHRYLGFIPYADAMDALSRALFSIDLSYRGYTNMSHWEPMWYGTPNFVESRIFEDEFCEVPRDLCEPFDLDESLPDQINSFQFDLTKVELAQKFVRDNCAPQNVARRILDAC
jgi:hypothetical protein